MMTRKHFVVLAAALHRTMPSINAEPERAVWWRTVHEITDVCSASNVAFDADRFRHACLGGK